MAKAAQTLTSIDVEVNRINEKVNEFQDYLENNTIVSKVNSEGEVQQAEEDTDRFKEIDVQIKMMDAVFRWLPILKTLRDDDEKRGTQVRGEGEVNGMFKSKQK